MNLRYSMQIRWSDEDGAFLVALPELYGEGRFATHGSTYVEAARRGQEVMALLIEAIEAKGTPLPEPWIIKAQETTA